MLTRRLIAPLALATGVALMAGIALAQPAAFQKGKKGDKKDFKKGGDKKDFKKWPFGEKKEPPKADATVEAWLKVLLDKSTDAHDVVRDSARAAIISVGPRAIPTLEKVAQGNDPAKAEAARRLVQAIRSHHNRAMPRPGRDAGPRGMPMGPGGFGGQRNFGRPGMGGDFGPNNHFGRPGMGGNFGPGAWGRGFGPMGKGQFGFPGMGPTQRGPKDAGKGKERKGDERKGKERRGDERKGKERRGGERDGDSQEILSIAPMPHLASQ